MGMNMQEMFGNLLPEARRKRKLTIKEAREVLTQEEAGKLIDMDDVTTRIHYSCGAVWYYFHR